jgi:nucleoside-diphosphate-sugar epimerase
MLPAQAQWIESIRVPVLMDSAKAERELDWHPEHDAIQTLREMVEAARERGLIGGD